MPLNFPSAMIYGDGQIRYLLPGVQDAFARTKADAAAFGIGIKVADFGGARTPAIITQLIQWRDEAVAAGEPYYRVSPEKYSKHARGGAFDFRVTEHPATMSIDQAYARVAQLARPHGLLWGGDFSTDPDIYHLESQQSVAQLQARWDAWVKDPAYPRMGFTEWSIVLALAAIVVFFFFVRMR